MAPAPAPPEQHAALILHPHQTPPKQLPFPQYQVPGRLADVQEVRGASLGVFNGAGRERKRGGRREEEKRGNEHRVRRRPLSFRSTPTGSFSLSHVSLRASRLCFRSFSLPLTSSVARSRSFKPRRNTTQKKQNRLPSGRCVREEFEEEKKTRKKRLGPCLSFFELRSFQSSCALSLSFALSGSSSSSPTARPPDFLLLLHNFFKKLVVSLTLAAPLSHSPFSLLPLLPTLSKSLSTQTSKSKPKQNIGRGGRPLQRPRPLGQALGRRAPLRLPRAGLLRGLGRRRARELGVPLHERGADPGGAGVLRLPDGDREHPLWYESWIFSFFLLKRERKERTRFFEMKSKTSLSLELTS